MAYVVYNSYPTGEISVAWRDICMCSMGREEEEDVKLIKLGMRDSNTTGWNTISARDCDSKS